MTLVKPLPPSAPPHPRQDGPTGRRLPRRVERRIKIARLILFWESLWPALWPAAGAFGFFVALALFGVFETLPMGLHWALLVGFGALLAWLLWRHLRGLTWPSREESLRHLERSSGLAHQPLAAYEDVPAEGTGDAALWAVHQRWVLGRLRKLKVGFAAPGLAARDPYALRAIVLLLLVIGFIGTGPGHLKRIAAAFLPGVSASRNISIESWITPPAYTGQAPIYLEKKQASADKTTGEKKSPVLRVPFNSVLSLRVQGLRTAPALEAGSGDRGRPEVLNDLGEGSFAIDSKISQSAEYALTQGGRLMRAWTIQAIPDSAPTIAFTKPVQVSASNTLRLAYKVEDDYGATKAEARIMLADRSSPSVPSARVNRQPAFPPAAIPRLTPPSIPLPLSTFHTKSASGETYADLTSHPWAGLPVQLTLIVRDDNGGEGRSTPVTLVLPARKFTNPLAAAIIEQRRLLAFSPYSTERVARFLGDFTHDGERNIKDKIVYLGLRSAYWRLQLARRDTDLTGIFDLLWSLALRVEDGGMSLAENDMRRARDALAEALARNAGNDEIERLMDEFRQSFRAYMEKLAANGGNKSLMEKIAPQGRQTINRSDLENMMNTIEELTKSGYRDQAKAMLAQLQSIMENMQTAGDAAMTGQEQALSHGLEQLDKLSARQRELMDRTFREGNKGADAKLKSLEQEQNALADELGKMMKQLESSGGKAPSTLGAAEDSMKSAGTRLGEGRADRASGAQGQAIERLREATNMLADALTQSMAARGAMPGGGRGAGLDPFGRPIPNGGAGRGMETAVPDKMGIQQARRIIEELRRRAGELGRPKSELDYLDRLLKRF